ncbi:MAG TPA: hypothetical protein VHF08_05365 [Nitrososphaeraceae archaeon]|nr:hypothetical protein [Nitrososphaeraceae archaeon]
MDSEPFQVICKYPSDENIDNEDFDSIEVKIKDKHLGPGHNNIGYRRIFCSQVDK